MRIQRVPQVYRNMKRYRQIIGILVKYGLGDLIDQLNLSSYIEMGRRFAPSQEKAHEATRLTRAKRLVLALEELGPTFIKIGQFLSTRPDLIPTEFIEELRKLQDEVPAFNFYQVKAQIESELDRPIEDLFSGFDEKPAAAASIGQVHTARLESGEKVVVKIQRPELEKIVHTDVDILIGLATLAERHIAESELYSPVGVMQEFARTMEKELDFTREGHSMERFTINFTDDKFFYVPRVYWDLTSKRILTMECIDGVKVSEHESLKQKGLDRKIIAQRGADAFLKQVLVYGLFHGDPHPGNIFVLQDNTICLLDYGIVGYVDDRIRTRMIRLIIYIIRKDVDGIVKVLLNIGIIDAKMDLIGFRADLLEFIERYYRIPLKRLDIGTIINEMFGVIHRYRIKVPSDLTLLAKALVLVESVGRDLDPDFDMIEHTRPFVKKLIRQRLTPSYLIKSSVKTLNEYRDLLTVLPRDTTEILEKIKKDQLTVGFEHKGIKDFILMLDKSTNRLSFSMIIMALIIGSSLIMQLDKGPLFLGFPVFGFLGYSIAAVLGLWLLITILRSRRL
ncbi:MAG: 2-polyprenylphenol 6-hydroxylase [Thermodesulfobacteriota bacterium]|nr:2-polyprenylphenol 6-hydroxylase [Thermodesulfobacteriota bacterium]